MTALAAREEIAGGKISAVELTEALLARIAERESDVGAFAHLDADLALAQAKGLDAHRASGRPLGPLHGLPVGLKDIVDTADLATENGTVVDAGRRPKRDAAIVSRLRAAGAVILGKTVTTELALFSPGKTANPRNLAHTPGGSSSGSAAAVADAMVPLAVGTQTNGSVIRPAAFCGVVGFKPTYGLIPRTGVLEASRSLDTIGTFARTVEDAALLADAMAGFDPADAATRPATPPQLLATARTAPPVRPALAFVKSPVWDRAEPETREAFGELIEVLGDDVDEIDLPAPFARVHDLHRVVMLAEIAKSYSRYYERGRDRLSAHLVELIEEGRGVLAHDYLAARDWMEVLGDVLDGIFDRYDAILTPAAPGPAPKGLAATGDPSFATVWTFCRVPAVSLPLLESSGGLPLGVQLVGRRGHDGRLLRTARWLEQRVAAETAQDAA
jgi:Asp-tRNA(Asn)/Glu-tRNA(Gln) amidotransferase A subunit family amidase